MLTAISRYGARVLPNTEQLVAGCKARGELIQGPQIAEFEAAFARRAAMDPSHAIAASYGRMAFYYILEALALPRGSEIVVPALTSLSCYGGGLALVRDRAVAARVRALAEAEPWPDAKRIENRLLVGKLQRIFIKPWVFTISAFPILWVSSLIGANPDVYLWEKIRSLTPLPDSYTERFPNVQAVLGLAALEMIAGWTARTRRPARGVGQAPGG